VKISPKRANDVFILAVVFLSFYSLPSGHAQNPNPMTRVQSVKAPSFTIPLTGPVEIDVTVYYQDAMSYWWLFIAVSYADSNEGFLPGTVTAPYGTHPNPQASGATCFANIPVPGGTGTMNFVFRVTLDESHFDTYVQGWYLWFYTALSDNGLDYVGGLNRGTFSIVPSQPTTQSTAKATTPVQPTTTTPTQVATTTTSSSSQTQALPPTTQRTTSPSFDLTKWIRDNPLIFVLGSAIGAGIVIVAAL
jgi:hypothetical protein